MADLQKKSLGFVLIKPNRTLTYYYPITNPNPNTNQPNIKPNKQPGPLMFKIGQTVNPRPKPLLLFTFSQNSLSHKTRVVFMPPPPSTCYPSSPPTLLHHLNLNPHLINASPPSYKQPLHPFALFFFYLTQKLHKAVSPCSLHLHINPQFLNCIQTASKPRVHLWRQKEV